MKTIAERIKDIRLELGATQPQFAKWAGGITKQAVYGWEKGNTVPDGTALMHLQRNKNINIDYILYGKKPKFIQQSCIKETITFGGEVTSHILHQGWVDKDKLDYAREFLANPPEGLRDVTKNIIYTISSLGEIKASNSLAGATRIDSKNNKK